MVCNWLSNLRWVFFRRWLWIRWWVSNLFRPADGSCTRADGPVFEFTGVNVPAPPAGSFLEPHSFPELEHLLSDFCHAGDAIGAEVPDGFEVFRGGFAFAMETTVLDEFVDRANGETEKLGGLSRGVPALAHGLSSGPGSASGSGPPMRGGQLRDERAAAFGPLVTLTGAPE